MSLLRYWMFSEATGSASADTAGGATATVAGDMSGESIAVGGFGRGRNLMAVNNPPGGYSGYVQMGGPMRNALHDWTLVIRFKLNVGFDFSAGPYGSYAVLGYTGDLVWENFLDLYLVDGGTGLTLDLFEDNLRKAYGEFTLASGDMSDALVTVVILSDGTATTMRVNGIDATMYDTDPAALTTTGYQLVGAYPDDLDGAAPFTLYEYAVFDAALTSGQLATVESGLPALFADPVVMSQHAAVLRQPQSLIVRSESAVMLQAPASLIVQSDPAAVLQPPAGYVFADWSSLLNALEVQYYYSCDISDGVTTIRAPISSWQATIQAGQASFVQAVFPAATALTGQIAAMAAPEFVICKGVRLADGSTREEEICRAPVQTPALSEGPTNATLTIQGYTTFSSKPGAARTLQNIRSQSNQGGVRIRCDIDLFLRPGQIAKARGREFVVRYINYYANADDNWMEVAE